MTIQQQAIRELAMRQLEERHKPQRDDLLEFMKYLFDREHPNGITKFNVEPFHKVIADRLHQCME